MSTPSLTIPNAGAPSAFSRRQVQLAIVAGIIAVLVGLAGFRIQMGTGGDEAEYVVLARALASGDGFVQLNEPDAPPDAKRLPGYPLLLALGMRLFGGNLVPLQFLSLVSWGLFIAIAFSLIARHEAPSVLIPVAAISLTLFNAGAYWYSSDLSSEALFAAVSLCALVVIQYAGDRHGRLSWVILAAVVVAIACYVRPNGLSLIPAAACHLAMRRRWLGALLLPTIVLAAVVPWFVRGQHLSQHGATYIDYTVKSTKGTGNGGLLTPTQAIARVCNNGRTRLLQLGQLIAPKPGGAAVSAKARSVAGEPPASLSTGNPAQPADDASSDGSLRKGLRYLVGGAIIMGLFLTLTRGMHAAHWYAIWTLGLLLVTPFTTSRYLMPLLPLWCWFLVGGLVRAADFLPSRLQSTSRLAVTALAVGACLYSALLTAKAIIPQVQLNLSQRHTPWYNPERYQHSGQDWVNYMRAAEWLRDNTPNNAVIVARKPHHVYLVSNRRAVNLLWTRDPEELWARTVALGRHGPVYIVQDAFGERYCGEDLSESHLVPMLTRHRAQFVQVYATPDPTTTIRQLDTSKD